MASSLERSAKFHEPPFSGADFPGCDPVRIAREDVRDHEDRYEFWDADTEIAWVVREGPSVEHEHPCQRLAQVVERIALERGSPIEAFGTAALTLRKGRREWWRVLRADQIFYLHPQVGRPRGGSIAVGEDRLPDVVLEVDHTTDVRRRKLGIYESWGVPELWVEVPDSPAPSRPKGVHPGLTIYVLEDGAYREVPKSRAFPGWGAGKIHLALNEPRLSSVTLREIVRVGRALGKAEGTGPDDDPQLGGHRRRMLQVGLQRGRLEGHAQGQAEGHAKGQAEGRAKGLAEARDQALAAQRSLLGMQAQRKFSDAVAVQLGLLLERAESADQFSEIAQLIVDCGTDEEVSARLR